MVDDFKKRPDGGFDVWIFRSKANQRVNTNHRRKGEKLILPNNPILINDYDRYIDLRPVSAEPNFYLQEVEEETGLQPYILSHDQQQLDMMTLLVDEIHKKTSSDNISPINSTDINKEQVNGTFLTAKEEANTPQIPLKSNNHVEIEMKPIQLQELLESGVLENTYLHIKLS
ncbi:unnamed protein product [Rhizophagus irregularis]|nr:unnamed protein product [Rhizophagus irregularis]